MASITSLTGRQQDFLTHLAMRNQNRSIQVSIALARVLSSQVPVPTSPVTSVDLFFAQQGLGVVDAVLNGIASVIPIDHCLTRDIAKSFFRYAYDVTHGGLPYEEGRLPTSGVVSFFRLDKHFSEEVLKTISVDHGVIETLVREFTMLAETIRGVNNVAE